MRRIAEKVGTIAQDLGSVNQVIDDEVQSHFSRLKPPRVKKRADDGNAVIGRALAGSAELNRAHPNPGCSRGLNPPTSRSDRAM